jgi:hypothetical protein
VNQVASPGDTRVQQTRIICRDDQKRGYHWNFMYVTA